MTNTAVPMLLSTILVNILVLLFPYICKSDTAQTLSRNEIMFGTCFDAPDDNKFNNSCLHLCEEEGECIDILFSCYPHDFCFVHCMGDNSCHNLTLLSPSDRIDTIALTCDGHNACKNIRFQTFDIDLSFEQNLKMYMPKYIKFNNFYPTGDDIDNSNIDNGEFSPQKTVRELIKQATQTIESNQQNKDKELNKNENDTIDCPACQLLQSDNDNDDNSNENSCENACDINNNENNREIYTKNRDGMGFSREVRQEWVTDEYLEALRIKPTDFELILESEEYESEKDKQPTDQRTGKSINKGKFDIKGMLDAHNNEDYEVVYGKHFMILRNFLKPEFLEEIKSLGVRLNKTGDYQEHREFGDAEDDPYHGHTVIYLNNQLPAKTYNTYKKALLGLFDTWQNDMINSSNHNSEINEDELTGFIDVDTQKRYDLSHDWMYFRDMADTYNARVIEFIDYALDGSLGWHTDDDSDLTMVTLLTDNELFNGGTLQFKQNTLDRDIESISLSYGDIVMFPSLADHRVLPVLKGTRQVLVIEWWEFPRNYFPGRHDPPSFWNLLKTNKLKQISGTDDEWRIRNIKTPYVFEKYNSKDISHMLALLAAQEEEDTGMEDENDSWIVPELNDKTIMLDNDLTFGEHFIKFHSVLTPNNRSKVNDLHKNCINKNDDVKRDEKRNFGYDEDVGGNIEDINDIDNDNDNDIGAYANGGHMVTYMNDCFDNDDGIYEYLKDIMLAGFDSLQYKCMINDSCLTPPYINDNFNEIWVNGQQVDFYPCYYIENENNIPLMQHYGWKHDWYTLFEKGHRLHSRVIEYINYGLDGTLGWHTDDDSMITMIALISNENDFEGGNLEFRSTIDDEVIETTSLSNGDVIIFPSMADHRVTPVTSGERKVLVIEWWTRGRSYFEGRLEPRDYDVKMRQLRRKERRMKLREDGINTNAPENGNASVTEETEKKQQEIEDIIEKMEMNEELN